MMTSGEDFEGTFSTSPSGTLISLLAISWINFATVRLYFQGQWAAIGRMENLTSVSDDGKKKGQGTIQKR